MDQGVLHEKAHAVGANTKYIKQFFTGLLEKEAKKFQLMGSFLKNNLRIRESITKR